MTRAGQTPHGARPNREGAILTGSACRLGALGLPGRSLMSSAAMHCLEEWPPVGRKVHYRIRLTGPVANTYALPAPKRSGRACHLEAAIGDELFAVSCSARARALVSARDFRWAKAQRFHGDVASYVSTRWDQRRSKAGCASFRSLCGRARTPTTGWGWRGSTSSGGPNHPR